MKVTVHQPWLIAPVDFDVEHGDVTALLHAKLWLVVDLGSWRERRETHLHVVRDPDGSQWRSVDLTGTPLRPWEGHRAGPPADFVECELRRWVSGWRLHFYRSRRLGIVSDVGESRHAFSRRAMGLLRPELQRQLDQMKLETPSRLPWRRRSRNRLQARRRRELAAAAAEVAGDIEEMAVEDVAPLVRSAEVGSLLVAATIDLRAPAIRDPLGLNDARSELAVD